MPKAGPLLSEYEQLRAQAVTERVAQLAAAVPEVRRFRDRVCNGNTLSPEQATRLLRSPATRVFTPEQFAQRGLSPVDHEVIGIVENHGSADGDYWRRCAARFQSPQPALVLERNLTIAAKLPTSDTGQILPERIPPLASYTFPAGDGTGQRIMAWPESVLDIVHSTGVALIEHYPWPELDALWFVLTGIAPALPVVRQEVKLFDHPHGRHAAIELAVAPWVSADTVLRAYRRLQREVLGGDNRPISMRNLALFRFVVAEQQAADGKATWREMLGRWNRAHPQWHYDDVRRFNRDWVRTERALLSADDRFSKRQG